MSSNKENTSGRKFIFSTLLLILTTFTLIGCEDERPPINGDEIAAAKSEVIQPTTDVPPEYWPKLNLQRIYNEKLETKVAEYLTKMTLEQKVAQMIQPEIRDITVEDMRQYGFGSYLNGGGSFPNNNKHSTPADWIELAEAMYQASVDDTLDGSSIPTMWGTDAVHGHNNVIGATLFPHNIGLGAANNPQLIEKIAAITAKEVMVTGIDWVFAPTVAVVRDDRWGRTYEGYSEDPEIVKRYANAIVTGLQGAPTKNFLGDHQVIATVKHFLGDGGTENGDDQGDNLATEQQLFDIHAQGYVSGLNAGAQTVMASFNSWRGVKNHGNHYLLTEVLKNKMGFDGLVVGDWNGHGQIPGCTNESCSQSINAGLDIFMVPTNAWKPLYEKTIQQVKNGEISLQRIDDAVTRILRVKMRAGIFDKPSPANRPLAGKIDLIGSADHRAVARQAVRESLVLLKNNNNILPINPSRKILIAGDAGDSIGKQSGGWTISWQGTGNNNSEFPGGTSIYQGIKQNVEKAGGSVEFNESGNYHEKPDVAIVVYGEEPYAEGNGDIDNLNYQRGNKKDLALIQRLKREHIPIVSVFISGRPMWVNPELNGSDAFVAAWLPGTEGGGIADVLIAKQSGEVDNDFTGRLSFSWPATPQQTKVNRFDGDYHPLFPYGFGLSYTQSSTLPDNLPEDFNAVTIEPQILNLLNAPWRPAFQVDNGIELITSNLQSNAITSYRTMDREVQDDARSLSFTGKTMSAFELGDNFPFDLRGYQENKSTIAFDVLFHHKISSPIYLGMRCETACDVDIDISSLFGQFEVDRWNTIKVDLNCFKNKGASMDKIFSPFVLKSRTPVELNLSNVKLLPHSLEQAMLNCSTAN